MVLAIGDGLGTHRGGALGAVCRRAYRRGDEAGLSSDPCAPRAATPRTGARTGARPVARRRIGLAPLPISSAHSAFSKRDFYGSATFAAKLFVGLATARP